MPSRSAHAASLLAAAFVVTGCASLQSSDNFLGVITPYRIEVVQGNVVTREQFELIKPGMSRAQVRDVLGSPLLADVFHAQRWDYVFTIRRQGAASQSRRVVAMFDGETLKSIDASSELPSEREFVASIDTFKPSGKAPILALTDEQIQALPVPEKAAVLAAEPVGPTRSYPPLEAKR